MRKPLEKKASNLNRTQNLTNEQLQALGAVVKFVVSTEAELDSLDPTFMDIAFVANVNKFCMWNGVVWIVIGSYPIGDIYQDITEIIGGNCAGLYVVDTENDLATIDSPSDGSLAWVNSTEAYYLYKGGWVVITIPTVANYINLPSNKPDGTIYYVSSLKAFYIARGGPTEWKCLTIIETLEDDLVTLPAISGDMAFSTDTNKYFIYTNGAWRLWDSVIEVVDSFPELPDEPIMIWHTGDNQIWSAGPLSATWVPLMSFTNLTGVPGS